MAAIDRRITRRSGPAPLPASIRSAARFGGRAVVCRIINAPARLVGVSLLAQASRRLDGRV